MLKEITAYEPIVLFDSYNVVVCKIPQKFYLFLESLGFELAIPDWVK